MPHFSGRDAVKQFIQDARDHATTHRHIFRDVTPLEGSNFDSVFECLGCRVADPAMGDYWTISLTQGPLIKPEVASTADGRVYLLHRIHTPGVPSRLKEEGALDDTVWVFRQHATQTFTVLAWVVHDAGPRVLLATSTGSYSGSPWPIFNNRCWVDRAAFFTDPSGLSYLGQKSEVTWIYSGAFAAYRLPNPPSVDRAGAPPPVVRIQSASGDGISFLVEWNPERPRSRLSWFEFLGTYRPLTADERGVAYRVFQRPAANDSASDPEPTPPPAPIVEDPPGPEPRSRYDRDEE